MNPMPERCVLAQDGSPLSTLSRATGQTCLLHRIRMLVTITAVALAVIPTEVLACSCWLPAKDTSWWWSDATVRVQVVERRTIGFDNYYVARVVETFNGCSKPGDLVVLRSPTDSAACGMALSVGAEWLVYGYEIGRIGGHRAYAFNSCDANGMWECLTGSELDFLYARAVSCPDAGVVQCADGSEPVSCPVDPCSDAPGCFDPTATCVSNACGGCYYEYWSDIDGMACSETDFPGSSAECPEPGDPDCGPVEYGVRSGAGGREAYINYCGQEIAAVVYDPATGVEDWSTLRIQGLNADELWALEGDGDPDLIAAAVESGAGSLWATGFPEHEGTPEEGVLSRLSQQISLVWDWLTEGCSFVPDFDFTDCCEEHDACYEAGGDWLQKLACDLALRDCISEKGHPVLSWVYGGAVAAFGWFFFD